MFTFFKTPRWFYGVDLNKWDYLGSTKIKWINKHNETLDEVNVLFFSSVKDTNNRFWDIPDDHRLHREFTSHPFIFHLNRWRICDYELWDLIETPSKFLKEKMLNQENMIWYSQEKIWKTENFKKENIIVDDNNNKENSNVIIFTPPKKDE